MGNSRPEIVWLKGHEALAEQVKLAWQASYDSDCSLPFVSSPKFAEFVRSTFKPPVAPVMLLETTAGSISGLLPLALRKDPNFLLGVRRLTHLNEWHAFRSDAMLTDPGNREVAARIFSGLTQRGPGDLVDLARIVGPEGSHFGDGMVPYPVVVHAQPRPIQGNKWRREFLRRRRRFEELPGACIRTTCDGPSVAVLAHKFVEMHTQLKRQQGQWALFDTIDGAAERFPESLATLASNREASVLNIMADKEMIGILILLHRIGHSTVAWRSAWNPVWARIGPGLMMLDEAINMSHERGETTFHLGPGVESYKNQWANSIENAGRLRFHRRTPRMLAARTLAWISRS